MSVRLYHRHTANVHKRFSRKRTHSQVTAQIALHFTVCLGWSIGKEILWPWPWSQGSFSSCNYFLELYLYSLFILFFQMFSEIQATFPCSWTSSFHLWLACLPKTTADSSMNSHMVFRASMYLHYTNEVLFYAQTHKCKLMEICPSSSRVTQLLEFMTPEQIYVFIPNFWFDFWIICTPNTNFPTTFGF